MRGKMTGTTAEEGTRHKAKEVCDVKANEEVGCSNGSSMEARCQQLPNKEVPHARVADMLHFCALPGGVIKWVIGSSNKVLGDIAISEHLISTGMTVSRLHPSVQSLRITSNAEQVKQGRVGSWARYLKGLRQHMPAKHRWAMKS